MWDASSFSKNRERLLTGEMAAKDYQIPFRFTGKLAKLTVKLGPEQLRAADRKVVQNGLAHAQD